MRDLILTLPSDYLDTTAVTPLNALVAGKSACVAGKIKTAPRVSYFRGKSRVTASLSDGTDVLQLVWFNQPWMSKRLTEGGDIALYGLVDESNRRLRMNSPRVVLSRGLIPVYKPLPGIPGKVLSDLIAQALTVIDDCCPETLPSSLRLRCGLCERNFAIRQAHFPESAQTLQIARRRLSFEQMLSYQAALSLLRSEKAEGCRIPVKDEDIEGYWRSLPFPPTGAQMRVLHEIARDLSAPSAMGRMVQGDVGSGKTAVALGAMYLALRAGMQSVLMAPTEILARQHLESVRKTLSPLGARVGMLTGSLKAAEKREALRAIEEGEWDAVVGTHALISEGVQYRNLGLVVTDEQHRFGVAQRKRLSGKAEEAPNVLVMSATPIPRTLALILYGDLSVSVLDEMPPGRSPVSTRIVPEEKRAGMYDFIRAQAKMGCQTYIVCPLVEESEETDAYSAQETYADLSNGALSDLRLGLTYGAQRAEEKAKTLEAFSAGKLDVLVSTTVVEVGVNVPRATCMVLENADRFGLSQLHQLRGRVGRSDLKSWCFLMGKPNERLAALCASSDGFEIAREDLKLRGPGDLLGLRQHGTPVWDGDLHLIEEIRAVLSELRTSGSEEEKAVIARLGRDALARMGEVELS